jgi:hypothetical protein
VFSEDEACTSLRLPRVAPVVSVEARRPWLREGKLVNFNGDADIRDGRH